MLPIINIRTSKIITVIFPVKGTVWFYNTVMHQKDADGMANSVDPDLFALFA